MRHLPFASLLLASLLFAPRAHACGSGGPGGGGGYGGLGAIVLGGATALGLDIGFTAYDLAAPAIGKPPSPAAAAAEIVVTAPQVAFLGYLASQSERSRGTLLLLGAWPAALMAHGIVTLADPPTPRPDRRARRVQLMPFVAREGSGLVVTGRF